MQRRCNVSFITRTFESGSNGRPSVATSSVSINAAFFAEIKEENQQLADLISLCREVFQPPPRRMRWQRRVSLLRRLRDQLAMHFALEDAYGYFEDAIDVAPRLAEEAERLRREHDELFLDICDIVDLAEQALYHEGHECTLARLCGRFQEFYHHLQAHEERENNLIFQAFDDDIGVGD